MSNISGKETKPEVLVRKYLFSKGFRFRKNDKRYPGKPDIILPKYKTVVFVHGCFWHGHKCRRARLPSTNREFWDKKISATMVRDKIVQKHLMDKGWQVIIIWQCEINNKSKKNIRLRLLEKEIKADQNSDHTISL